MPIAAPMEVDNAQFQSMRISVTTTVRHCQAGTDTVPDRTSTLNAADSFAKGAHAAWPRPT